ncbi:hypothetical protein [Mycoplasmopsis opalescens]|uniref:hypothetical protein n=1 Tax=Mycoplasmopsis opalescens TaxID=114886 RepID=UPI0012EC4B40|nr:hypothetical protein [Mycoplasmopsis opalescens]
MKYRSELLEQLPKLRALFKLGEMEQRIIKMKKIQSKTNKNEEVDDEIVISNKETQITETANIQQKKEKSKFELKQIERYKFVLNNKHLSNEELAKNLNICVSSVYRYKRKMVQLGFLNIDCFDSDAVVHGNLGGYFGRKQREKQNPWGDSCLSAIKVYRESRREFEEKINTWWDTWQKEKEEKKWKEWAEFTKNNKQCRLLFIKEYLENKKISKNEFIKGFKFSDEISCLDDLIKILILNNGNWPVLQPKKLLINEND